MNQVWRRPRVCGLPHGSQPRTPKRERLEGMFKTDRNWLEICFNCGKHGRCVEPCASGRAHCCQICSPRIRTLSAQTVERRRRERQEQCWRMTNSGRVEARAHSGNMSSHCVERALVKRCATSSFEKPLAICLLWNMVRCQHSRPETPGLARTTSGLRNPDRRVARTLSAQALGLFLKLQVKDGSIARVRGYDADLIEALLRQSGDLETAFPGWLREGFPLGIETVVENFGIIPATAADTAALEASRIVTRTTTPSTALMGALAAEIALTLESLGMEPVEVRHIPGTSNNSADALSRLLRCWTTCRVCQHLTARLWPWRMWIGLARKENPDFVTVCLSKKKKTKGSALCRGAWRRGRQSESPCVTSVGRPLIVVTVRDGVVGKSTLSRRLFVVVPRVLQCLSLVMIR